MSTELRFKTERLREQGGLQEDLELDAARFIDREVPGARPEGRIRISLEFSLGGTEILLQARVQGTWQLVCSRCLAEHRVDYDCSIEEAYPLEQEELDAGEDLRQAVLLEVPPRSLCREDCRGLCPQCGKNLNAAPCACRPETPSPFAVLKKLAAKEKPHAEP